MLRYQPENGVDLLGWAPNYNDRYPNQFYSKIFAHFQEEFVYEDRNYSKYLSLPEILPATLVFEEILDLPTTSLPRYDCEICETIYVDFSYQENFVETAESRLVFTGIMENLIFIHSYKHFEEE